MVGTVFEGPGGVREGDLAGNEALGRNDPLHAFTNGRTPRPHGSFAWIGDLMGDQRVAFVLQQQTLFCRNQTWLDFSQLPQTIAGPEVVADDPRPLLRGFCD